MRLNAIFYRAEINLKVNYITLQKYFSQLTKIAEKSFEVFVIVRKKKLQKYVKRSIIYCNTNGNNKHTDNDGVV